MSLLVLRPQHVAATAGEEDVGVHQGVASLEGVALALVIPPRRAATFDAAEGLPIAFGYRIAISH